jgi:hypothetical protein
MFYDVPTGSDGEAVSEYYDYLYNHYVTEINQTYRVNVTTLLWWGFFVVILVGSIYLATRLQRATRSRGEPYPVESYNGYITETNGPTGPFLMIVFGGIVVWLLGITIFHLVQGQIY